MLTNRSQVPQPVHKARWALQGTAVTTFLCFTHVHPAPLQGHKQVQQDTVWGGTALNLAIGPLPPTSSGLGASLGS